MITVGSAAYSGYQTRELSVPGRGPKVVLLHGFAHAAEAWQQILQRCAAANIAALAVDLPGFGAADPIAPGPRLPQLDAFVSDLITRHSTDAPVLIVGNSLGGLLAVRAAASADAERIAAGVAVNAAGFGWTPPVRLLSACGGRLFDWIDAVPIPSAVRRRTLRGIAAYGLYGDRRAIDPTMVRLLTDQFENHQSRKRLLSLAREFITEVNALHSVPDARCPITVVHGRKDPIVSLAASQRLADAIRNSRLIVVERSGHCPQLDAPDTLFAVLRGLTDDRRTRRPA